jgi:phospholipid/cholesterol/gamma-HCH transport system substrate-binding protein
VTAIRKHLKDFLAIILLLVIAAGIAGYILSNQRLRFPLVQPAPVKMYADFSTAQAVTPGQGQSVRVSGVQVGEIGGVTLKNGVARVLMNIDDTYKNVVHTDATALLRPKTGLKDMFIELNPGTKSAKMAKAGFTIPINNTLPDVNPDETLSLLDADTRDYVQLLIDGGAQGLKGRGNDLQSVFAAFLPTHRDIARVNVAVAQRHQNLSRLIHSLNLLNTALAQRGPTITQLVSNSSQVFNGFATEQAALQRALVDFPGTLRQTTNTLGKVHVFANVLGATTENLRPAVRALAPANRAIVPFALKTTPVIKNQIRPFVIDSRPLVRALKPASQNLAKATPNLTTSFGVLNHLFNMLGYNKAGSANSSTSPGGDSNEGYLFWLAWLDHNAASVFANADAHGVYRALTQQSTCATLSTEVGGITTPLGQAQGQVAGILGTFVNPAICGGSTNLTLPTLPNLPGVPTTVPAPGLPPLPAKKAAKR